MRNDKSLRNHELLADYERGMEIVELVIKYHISPARIYQIINRQREKNAQEI